MDRDSLACGVSPRQGLCPHSPNTSSVNGRVSRYFYYLIYCRRALAAFGITHHDDQNPELSPASSTCQSTEQTTSGKTIELLNGERPPPSSRTKPKPTHDTEKHKNISCKTCNTPSPIAPRKRENPQNSQYSKPNLKTETRKKKIEKRAKMKEELETRRQQMK